MDNGNFFNKMLKSRQRQKPPEKNTNFKYLDYLIHSGEKEIVLESDIILDEDEELMYLNGIEIYVDGIVIDGGGHSIDACEKTRIFICSCKSVRIKNITLKKGFTEGDGGAIYNDDDCKLTVCDATFDGNRADNRGGAIKNRGEADISKSIFNENTAGNCGAIENNGKMNICDSQFAKSIATAKDGGAAAIFNDECCSLKISGTIISECRNRDDSTTVYSGGGIYNNGDLTVTGSTFTQNRMESGSAILNYGGVMNIRKSDFSHNTTGLGAAIENYGEANISETTLSKNVASRGGGAAISNKYKSKMTISKSELKNNSVVYGSSVQGAAVYNDGEMDMMECTLTANIANQGGERYVISRF